MKTGTVIGLVAAAAVVGAAAWLVQRSARSAEMAPSDRAAGATKQSVFLPEVAAKVNEIASVTVSRGGQVWTIAKTDGQWVLTDKGGYPAKLETVKGIVVGLAQLSDAEPKTSRPEKYKEIGVQDPPPPVTVVTDPSPAAPEESAAGTGGALVTLKDTSGATVASVIVGNSKYGGGAATQVYVRKAGETQSWLATGKVDVPAQALGWIDSQVLNIGRERVKSATVTHPDGHVVTVTREMPEQASFTVQGVPAGRELTTPAAGDTLGSALSYLTVEDLALADSVGLAEGAAVPEGAEAGPRVEFRMFDGLVIDARLMKKDGKTWAVFTPSFDEAQHAAAAAAAPPPAPEGQPQPPAPATSAVKPADEVKKEIAEIQSRSSKWAFVVPEWKARSLMTRMEELLKPETAAAEAPSAVVPGAQPGDATMPPPPPTPPTPDPSP